jgi:iron complex outermembrane receptor protein
MTGVVVLCGILLQTVAAGAPGVAAADAGTLELAPVDVTLIPGSPSAPWSPENRDPSYAVATVAIAERRGEAKDTADFVGTATGALIQDLGGAGQRKTLSLRGSSPNGVLVLLDGVPLSGSGGAVDLSKIPAALLDKVEVLRGGASARFGPGALGGVANLVTRAPRGLTIFSDVSMGSFQTTRVTMGGTAPTGAGETLVLLHALGTGGRFPYTFDATPILNDEPPLRLLRDNNHASQGGILVRHRLALAGTTVDVIAEGFADRRGLAGPVHNPSPEAEHESTRGTFSGRAHTSLESGGELASLAWGRIEATRLAGSIFGGASFRQRESSIGGEVMYTRLFRGRHGLSVLGSAGGEFLKEPSGKNPSWARAGAMLGGEELLLEGRVVVNGAIRLDVAGSFVVFSPKLGVSAQLPLGFEVRANFGQAARTPSFLELYVMQGTLLPNPELRPERALTGDVALAWANEVARVAATGFWSLYEDLISYEYYPPWLSKPYNFQAARIAGLEIEAHARPHEWFDATAAYTWMTTQNLRDDPRYYLKSLPFRPTHRVVARLAVGPPIFRGSGELQFQSQQFQNRTETLVLGDRAFFNVGISSLPWKKPQLMLSLEIKNLFDVQSQDMDGYPLMPRGFFATLSVAWEGEK